MKLSRRRVIQAILGTASARLLGQGVSSRKTAVPPRGKPSGRPFHSQLTDIGQPAGLTHPTVYGGIDRKKYIVETIGCGCAFLDYDNDGWMDIFVLSGSRFEGITEDATNRLYKNNRDGTFHDVTREAGLAFNGWCCGVCVGDFNNDGNEDLFITGWGRNILYRNNGDGTFSDVTKEAGLASVPRWGTGCSFVDYNRDGHLDLFVSNYLEFDLAKAPSPGSTANCQFKGVSVNCGPRGFAHGRHSLYRNNGDGTFTDVSVSSGIAEIKGSYGLTVVTADFDDDGWPDIFVACDSTPSLLLMNNHDGTFREEALLRGVAYSEDGQEQAGMGVAATDFDGDGNIDILKTNFADDVLNLYRNVGKGNFEDVAADSGLATDNRFVSWGAGLVDFDNDGATDVFIVTGHVYPEIERPYPSYPFRGPRLLFRNLGNGRFEEMLEGAGPALGQLHASRGCAFGDFDNDGDIDVLIVNLNEPPSLLRNDTSGVNHWLKVKLVGTTSNRSAIGARVTVTSGAASQTQEVQSQSSFLSANDPRLHFGLALAEEARVHVRWPSGKWTSPITVRSNRLVTIQESVGIIANAGHAMA